MAYNNLMTKLESAAATVYAATVSPADRFTGIEADGRTVPNATFIGQQGSETPQGSGNYNATLVVKVYSNADISSETTHKNLAGAVFDVFSDDGLPATLSAAEPDFTVFGIAERRMSESTEARMHVSTLEVDCYLCGSDIS